MQFADTIAEYLKNAPAPVPLKKLRKEMKFDVTAPLAEALQSGAAFAWPKYRRAERYWHREPADFIREQMLAIAAESAASKKDLLRHAARLCHNCGTPAAQAALASLLNDGALKIAKTVGATGFYYRPDAPRALIGASMKALWERLRKYGIEAAEPRSETAQATTAPLPERILEVIRRIQPAPAIPVTVQSLRAAVPAAPKREFDEAVLSLADAHRIYLTTHDHGWALPEAEREQLVSDGGQKLYVAVTLRD